MNTNYSKPKYLLLIRQAKFEQFCFGVHLLFMSCVCFFYVVCCVFLLYKYHIFCGMKYMSRFWNWLYDIDKRTIIDMAFVYIPFLMPFCKQKWTKFFFNLLEPCIVPTQQTNNKLIDDGQIEYHKKKIQSHKLLL